MYAGLGLAAGTNQALVGHVGTVLTDSSTPLQQHLSFEDSSFGKQTMFQNFLAEIPFSSSYSTVRC